MAPQRLQCPRCAHRWQAQFSKNDSCPKCLRPLKALVSKPDADTPAAPGGTRMSRTSLGDSGRLAGGRKSGRGSFGEGGRPTRPVPAHMTAVAHAYMGLSGSGAEERRASRASRCADLPRIAEEAGTPRRQKTFTLAGAPDNRRQQTFSKLFEAAPDLEYSGSSGLIREKHSSETSFGYGSRRRGSALPTSAKASAPQSAPSLCGWGGTHTFSCGKCTKCGIGMAVVMRRSSSKAIRRTSQASSTGRTSHGGLDWS